MILVYGLYEYHNDISVYTHIYVCVYIEHFVEAFTVFAESFQILVVDPMLRHHKVPPQQGQGMIIPH